MMLLNTHPASPRKNKRVTLPYTLAKEWAVRDYPTSGVDFISKHPVAKDIEYKLGYPACYNE